MIVYEPATHDPALNLALEEYYFRRMAAQGRAAAEEETLLLWQNAPSVIVGRHQNIQTEVCASWLAARNIPVVRRLTGGGAVYHDLGNLNYTFLAKACGPVAFHPFLRRVAAALQTFGIAASLNSRNDLAVEGRKISGSAQLRHNGVTLHHGTLLYDVDMEAMANALRPSPDKLALKGLSSVRARVMNLKDILPADVGLAALREAIIAACSGERRDIANEALDEAHNLARTRYRSWEWNAGASPAVGISGRRRFAWGELACSFEVKRGRIARAAMFGDFFGEGPQTLEHALTGVLWQRETVAGALAGCDISACFYGCDPAEVEAFILSFIE